MDPAALGISCSSTVAQFLNQHVAAIGVTISEEHRCIRPLRMSDSVELHSHAFHEIRIVIDPTSHLKTAASNFSPVASESSLGCLIREVKIPQQTLFAGQDMDT